MKCSQTFLLIFLEKLQSVTPTGGGHCGGPAPTTFFCVRINSVSISLDNSPFTHQYRNSSLSTMAEFLQFTSLPRLSNTSTINKIHLEIVALVLACV